MSHSGWWVAPTSSQWPLTIFRCHHHHLIILAWTVILPLLLQLSRAIIGNHGIRIKVGGEMGNSKVNGYVISLNVSAGISQADRKSLGKTILKQSQETQDSHFLRCVSDFYWFYTGHHSVTRLSEGEGTANELKQVRCIKLSSHPLIAEHPL